MIKKTFNILKSRLNEELSRLWERVEKKESKNLKYLYKIAYTICEFSLLIISALFGLALLSFGWAIVDAFLFNHWHIDEHIQKTLCNTIFSCEEGVDDIDCNSNNEIIAQIRSDLEIIKNEINYIKKNDASKFDNINLQLNKLSTDLNIKLKPVLKFYNNEIVTKNYVLSERSSFSFYYKLGSLILDKNYMSNSIELEKLNSLFFNKISKNKRYDLIIIGRASEEKITPNTDRVSNNYELSYARAENIKNIILNKMYNKLKFQPDYRINLSGGSNEYRASNMPNKNRKVDLTIYSYVMENDDQ